jgi:threonine dehydratase
MWKKLILNLGHDMAAAKKTAMELSRDRGMPYINGYDHPLIMAGQGTIGLEIVEQCEGADAIVIPGKYKVITLLKVIKKF